MTVRLAFLSIALVGMTGLAPAQATSTSLTPQHTKPVQIARSAEAPTPTAKPARLHGTQAMAGRCSDHQAVAMTDEYGFRYDSFGDRLNAGGCVIPPPHTLPGARVVQD